MQLSTYKNLKRKEQVFNLSQKQKPPNFNEILKPKLQ